ncbi:DUF262 domain-containing HNH endonuclease family protein (plasmid) [Entomospira nematocerorum]|uniref:DUF262 domain-containing protein n=1 Tax=Entomospira nematocerorum TaxID=2719987 RepID=A0A968GDJ9_9SPIO|nr:DUF262 domain-containing protein [Entomospira nematocera]NIZ47840.1 DUF262 domain-containing protein [Entomospira nematocera]WDI34790.1 DUF262 domain-containing HNH endonuclease family protein [Entomospira nematocera]
MDVEAYSFSKLMTTDIAELEIPYFQRGYVWKEENWDKLWDTLENNNKSNFLGSIILKKIEGKIDKRTGRESFLIIDGQQRLTTLSILVKAAYDYISIKGSTQDQKKRCFNNALELLTDTDANESEKFSLLIKHSHKDQAAYKEVMNLNTEVNTSEEVLKRNLEILKNNYKSNKKKGIKKEKVVPLMIQCYSYFFNKINSPEKAINILTYLVDSNYKILVGIKLKNDDDDEQNIFDTLNSAGAKLFISDIIKNSIFQEIYDAYKKENGAKADNLAVVELYLKYWENKFEPANDKDKVLFWQEDLRPYNHLTQFLIAYAVIKGFFHSDKNRNILPKKFTETFGEVNQFSKMKDKLEEIEKYSDLYYDFKTLGNKYEQVYQANTNLDNIQKRLSLILNSLNISAFDAYILDLLYKNKYENIAIERDLCDLEKYIIITQIINSPTKEYETDNKKFLENNNALYEKAKQLRTEIYGSIEASQNSDINDDNKVLLGLKELDRQKSIKLATQLLFWLELNERNQESDGNGNNIYAKLDGLQLEHILPKKWQEHWPVEGEEHQLQRERAVHKFGNMTLLTAKINKNISNYAFNIKMKGSKDGKIKGIEKLGESSLLNKKHLINPYNENKLVVWDEAAIDDRTRKLTDLVLKLWDLPKN